MAKIIEIMGPVAVGKTTICKHFIGHYKNDSIFGFLGPKKRNIHYWREEVEKNTRFRYIITESRLLYDLILMKKGLCKTDDHTDLFRQETLKEEFIEEALEEIPNFYMMIHFHCRSSVILDRLGERGKNGRYYNFMSDEDKIIAVRNVTNYIRVVSNVLRRKGIYVYTINTEYDIESSVQKIRNILEYHRWKVENFYV